MNIVFVNDDFPPHSSGGAAIVVDRLSKSFAEAGHEVTVISTHRTKNFIEHRDGRKIIWLKTDYNLKFRWYVSLYNKQVINRLRKILIDINPDVVNFHNIHTYISYHSLKVSKNLRLKVFLTGHDVMPFYFGRLNEFIDSDGDGILDTLDYRFNFWSTFKQYTWTFNPFRNQLNKYYLRNYVDKIIVVSEALKKVYEYHGLKNTVVINNGINLDEWKIDSSKVQKFIKKNRIPQNKFTLFFGGRIRKDKGSLIAIRALLLDPDTFLVVAGEIDGGVVEMKNEAVKLGVEKRILYLGSINPNEIKYVYKATSATIVPSICFDSYPNNAIESLCSKKPVLLSKFAGRNRNLITKYLITFNPFNISQISKVLSKAKKLEKIRLEINISEINHEKQFNNYLNLFEL